MGIHSLIVFRSIFMDSLWTVYGKKADFAAIGEKYNIDQVVARVIRNRDIIEDKDIDMFLNGGMDSVHDPSLMRDMDKACSIMREKILSGKKIRIISDYDVDGVMSNYILLAGLRNAGADADYEIPDRMTDGYGINERIVQAALEDGVDTIITCDNGIAAFPALELAKENGMTVIVTDHHEVPYEIVDGQKICKMVPADAIVDIKNPECQYPFKELCGAGVAYKFIKHLYRTMDIEFTDEAEYIQMVAIATVCDVMTLKDENRVYVREGLKLIKNTNNVGLNALLSVNDLAGRDIYTYHLGFVIGPCINAAGRLDTAKAGLELLLETDRDLAMKRAYEIKELNVSRKQMTEEGAGKARDLIEKEMRQDTVLVVYMPDLHESLAGIVAGRIKDAYYRPVYVVTSGNGGMLKGSGRSIEGYNMFDELSACEDLLTKFGGHELAAGFSLEKDKLQEFRERLNKNVKLSKEQLTPVLRIDVPMPVSYISKKLIEDLNRLEPFGKGNEKPLFAQAGLKVKKVKLLGNKGQYIKIYFEDENGYMVEAMDFDSNNFIDCIKMWFSETECDKMLKGLANDIVLDVAYYPDINEYMGRTTIQIKPVKYRRSARG